MITLEVVIGRGRLIADAPVAEVIAGVPAERVGDLAHELGVRLHELHTERASLEEAYMELTADSVQYGVAVAS